MAKYPRVKQLKGRPIGRVLIKMGVLTNDKVHQALKMQKAGGAKTSLGVILQELGFISDTELSLALAFQLGMEYMSLDEIDIDDDTVEQLTTQMATTYRVVPVEFEKETNTLTIAMDSSTNFRASDDLRTLLGLSIKTVIAERDHLEKILHRYYSEENESISVLLGVIATDDMLEDFKERGDSIDLTDLKEMADSNPVKRLLNLVLLQAIRDQASDVHFEPFEKEFKMRYRVDGVLYEMVPPPSHISVAIASRIKVMANLDIAERRLPQDGRIALEVKGQQVDLRVSILPTLYGESVVLRILDRTQVDLDIDKLGMRRDDADAFRQMIHRPNGIVIVTGPTGSGKTTSLYSALNELNDIERKIITTEDPVEYDIDGIIQVQINTDIGLTFSRCLRSILRQDPDVVLVGEIRDLDTAKIAVEAALTGHLVFSTLHTNDSPSSIARMIDLGLEPFMISATLEGIIGQRLVRRICKNCKEPFIPNEDMLFDLKLTPEDVVSRTFYQGIGCDYCNNTGYKGRMGLYEMMTLNEAMRDAINNNSATSVIKDLAVKRGMRQMRDSGIASIFDGETTIDEVVRETLGME